MDRAAIKTGRLLSTLSTRAPQRVIEIAYKVMRYLKKTNAYALKVKAEGNKIHMYPDAAFAPVGSRSHSRFVVMWGNTHCLAKLKAGHCGVKHGGEQVECHIGGRECGPGVESMLYDLNIHVKDWVIASDSMSALTISSGTGSWTTRHFRIKASWLQEMLAAGVFTATQCPGILQLADLLTKALPVSVCVTC